MRKSEAAMMMMSGSATGQAAACTCCFCPPTSTSVYKKRGSCGWENFSHGCWISFLMDFRLSSILVQIGKGGPLSLIFFSVTNRSCILLFWRLDIQHKIEEIVIGVPCSIQHHNNIL